MPHATRDIAHREELQNLGFTFLKCVFYLPNGIPNGCDTAHQKENLGGMRENSDKTLCLSEKEIALVLYTHLKIVWCRASQKIRVFHVRRRNSFSASQLWHQICIIILVYFCFGR
jgi:hypothetical protein